MNWLFEPKITNYLLLALYFLGTIRWAFEQNWAQTVYWLGAFILTISVTFMME